MILPTYTQTIMQTDFVDNLIENVYRNSRISNTNRSMLSICKKLIIDLLKKELYGYRIKFINQGSYATFTQISNSDDLDIDIGVVFHRNYKSPTKYRKKIYDILTENETMMEIFTIEPMGKCCVKMILKDVGLNDNSIKFEISVYKKIYEKVNMGFYKGRNYVSFVKKIPHLYFGIGNKWKRDEKVKQMMFVKKKLAQDNDVRKIIMFLKSLKLCFDDEIKIPSIIILEIVIQNYDYNDNVSTNTIKLLNLLINVHTKFKKKYELFISGDNSKENLLNNDIRRFDKNKLLNFIIQLCNDIVSMCHNSSFVGCKYIKIAKKEIKYVIPFCDKSIHDDIMEISNNSPCELQNIPLNNKKLMNRNILEHIKNDLNWYGCNSL